MPIGAIVGASVVGAGASVISGNNAAGATRDAAATSDATNRYIYDSTRADYAPQREAGYSALSRLMQMYGLKSAPAPAATTPSMAGGYGGYGQYGDYGGVAGNWGAAPAAAPAQAEEPFNYTTSPGYQFRMGEAMKAIERSAAARGRLRSGATMDALQRRAQGVATDDFETQANRMAQIAGFGSAALGATSQAGANYAGQQTQTNMAAGQARASAYQNTGNAINNTVGNLAGAYLYNQGYAG